MLQWPLISVLLLLYQNSKVGARKITWCLRENLLLLRRTQVQIPELSWWWFQGIWCPPLTTTSKTLTYVKSNKFLNEDVSLVYVVFLNHLSIPEVNCSLDLSEPFLSRLNITNQSKWPRLFLVLWMLHFIHQPWVHSLEIECMSSIKLLSDEEIFEVDAEIDNLQLLLSG